MVECFFDSEKRKLQNFRKIVTIQTLRSFVHGVVIVFGLGICCLAMTRCYSARTSSARFMSASSSVAAPLRRAKTSSRIRLLIRKPLAYQIATRRFKLLTNAAFLPGRYLLPIWVRVLARLQNPVRV
jgi:hypothetical protein